MEVDSSASLGSPGRPQPSSLVDTDAPSQASPIILPLRLSSTSNPAPPRSPLRLSSFTPTSELSPMALHVSLASPRTRASTGPQPRTEERTKTVASVNPTTDASPASSPRHLLTRSIPESASPRLSEQASSLTFVPSRDRMEELRRLMVMILDDISQWVDGLQTDIDSVRTIPDIGDKRDDCLNLMQVKSVLAMFPVGTTSYQSRTLPDVSSTTSSPAEAQRLLNFLKSTNFVLWEVKTKAAIIKKYVSMTDAWTRLLTVGRVLNKMRRYFPTDKATREGMDVSPPLTPPSPGATFSFEFEAVTSPVVSGASSPLSSPSSPLLATREHPPLVPSHQPCPLSLSAPSASTFRSGSSSQSPRHTSATLPSPRNMHLSSSPSNGSPYAIPRSDVGRAQVRRSAHVNNFPARKRLTSLHLFFTSPDNAAISDSDDSPRIGETDMNVSGDDLDDQERMRQLYVQHDKTIHRLSKGAGISKVQADRFLELLKEMQIEGDFTALASGAMAQSIQADSRVTQLRAGISRPHHAGPIMLFSKGWKKFWGTVDQHSIKFYSSTKCEKLIREVLIGEIVCINPQDKVPKEGQHEFMDISLTCGSQLSLSASSAPELVKWIVSIDGMKDRSVITTSQKLVLLRSRYFTGIKGGSIKSVDEEEWTYNGRTGELNALNGVMVAGQRMAVSYIWNGQTLVPTRSSGRDSILVNNAIATAEGSCVEPSSNGVATNGRYYSFGSGLWDGVTLLWFCEAGSRARMQDFTLMQPDYIYLWDEQEREFIDGKSSDQMHWKFSRHFLASKSNHGHWIMEGDIPEPVVMSLQLMRYVRYGVPTVVDQAAQAPIDAK